MAMGVSTCDERIQRFHTVHKPVLDQLVQCTVYLLRCTQSIRPQVVE